MSWNQGNAKRECMKLLLVLLGVGFLFFLWLFFREHDPMALDYIKDRLIEIGAAMLVIVGVLAYEKYSGD